MASLNFLERNILVRALREGKTWDEAVKLLPPAINRATVEKAWREWAEAEAKKDAEAEPITVKYNPEEMLKIRAENAEISKAMRECLAENAALRTVKENTASSLAAVAKERDAALAEVTKLKKEIEELSAQVEVLSAPSKKK